MTSNRIKLAKAVVATRAEAESILGEISADQAKLNGLKAELDAAVTAIRQQYEGAIDEISTTIERKTGLLQQWAIDATDEFEGKKSIEFIHGRLGFRIGNPKLKTLSGWTFDRVLSVVDSAWVRIEKELDKQGLLGAYARGEVTDAQMRQIGCRVVQEETFFVEPKLEEVAKS